VGDSSPAAGDCVSPPLELPTEPDVGSVGVSTAGGAAELPTGELDVLSAGMDGGMVCEGSPAVGDCVALAVGPPIGPGVSDIGLLDAGGSVGVSAGELDAMESDGE